MMPDVVRPGGIGKTTVTNFGGIDRRPDAEDWTLMDTENMTPAKWPRLAARKPRMSTSVAKTEDHWISDQFFHSVLAMDDVLLSVRYAGYIYYNYWNMCQASDHGEDTRLCRFGRKVILTKTKQIINLTWPLLGTKATTGELPGSQTAQEGDAWLVGTYGSRHIYVYESGSWVDKEPLVEDLEASVTLLSMEVMDGIYQDAPAEMNTIRLSAGTTGVDFTTKFKPGDAVTISGCAVQPRNNITATVREVKADELRFYENTFRMPGKSVYKVGAGGLIAGSLGQRVLFQVTGWYDDGGTGKVYFTLANNVPEGGWLEFWQASGTVGVDSFDEEGTLIESVTPSDTYDPELVPDGPKPLPFAEEDRTSETGYTEGNVSGITISRKWPELDGIFEHNNRLWGWKDRTIYASNIGDASNWNRFDGLADDAWSVTLQRPEPITGGISVHGLPTFFTEFRRFQVYGSAPAEYQLAEQDCHGVRKGCADAMAVVDGVLYYPSRFGIMADSGGVPESCGQALGGLRLIDAVAGSWGHEYWIAGEVDGDAGGWTDGDDVSLIYDTRSGIWIRDGERRFRSFAQTGGRFAAVQEGAGSGAPNPLTILHGDAPWTGFVGEETISWRLVSNVFTQAEPNRKRVHRIQIRAELATGSGLTVKIRYDSKGTWNTVWTVAGDDRRKSWYLPVLIRRCDHFMLQIEGSGGCVIHSIALETRKGSAVF